MNHRITTTASITINRPREAVWDFTQDYSHRMKWDLSVIEATLLPTDSVRTVRLRTSGNTTMTFVYKLDDRPNQTSLIGTEIKSPFIRSAAGSWRYEDLGGATRWTQTNTVELKRSIFSFIIVPLFRYVFGAKTRKAMQRAKELIEIRE